MRTATRSTNYTGSHDLTFTGPGTIGTYTPTVTSSDGTATNFGTAMAINFAGGVATVSGSNNGVMMLYKVETAHIMVSDDSGHNNGAGLSVTVSAAAANRLVFTQSPGNTVAGLAFAQQPQVTVQDQYGNTVTGDSSTVTLAIKSGTPTSGGPGSLTGCSQSESSGVITFSGCKITTAGTGYQLQATDGSLTAADSTAFNITAAAANRLVFTQSPGNTVAGLAFAQQPQVTVQDQYGNTVTGDSSTVTLAIKSGTPTSGGPGSLTGCSQSESSGVITFSGCKITTAGTGYQLQATDGSLTAADSTAFNITAGGLNSFTITTPATPAAGTPFSVSITAKDAYGNTVTAYTGAQCIAFSGPAASPNGTAPSYPPLGSCTAGSAVTFANGVAGTVNITLYNASASTVITATDVPTSKSGSTNPFNVNGTGAPSQFVVLPATTGPIAGVADNLTITMGDLYGNPVTTYTGPHNLIFSGASNAPNGTHPTVTNSSAAINFGSDTEITFTAGVAIVSGSNNGVMRLYKVEAAPITVRQSTGIAYTSNTLTFNVQPGSITTFTVANPGARTAGTTFNVSISLTDTYGNSNVGIRCLSFSGPANAPDGTPPSYPAQGSCAAGQSEVNFTAAPTPVPITLYRAANPTNLTVTDITSTLVRTTGNFTVNPAAIDHFSMTAADTTPLAGTTDALTITARDTWDNTATSYTGRHNLTFTGASMAGTTSPTVTDRRGNVVNFGTAESINFLNGVSNQGGVMRLYKAETANITVKEGGSYTSSPLTVTVNPATISSLSLAAATTTPTAGDADNLTITALDAYGNTATSYTASHSLTFSGTSAITNSPFTPSVTNSSDTVVNFGGATEITFSAGVATVSGTSNGVMTLYKGGASSIVVRDGTYSNGSGLSVTVKVVASQVSAGGYHTCALLSYGGVECWGENNYGQLGNNSTTNSSTAVAVSGITTAIQISAGKFQTCALLSSGVIDCWGRNNYGQLGNGTTTDSRVPVQVSNITTATQLSANTSFTCALLSGGTVDCWGYNADGQLGNGTTTNSNVPVVVLPITGSGSLANVTAVATGGNQACALISGGTVDCWGDNGYGELGNNSMTDSSRPVAVVNTSGSGTLSSVSSLSGGRYHSCAVLTSGAVDCWGYNTDGQLGNNSTTNSSIPVAVSSISTATQVSGGEYYTCARLSDETARCWGDNTYGQLGNNSVTDSHVPVTVVSTSGSGSLANVTGISAGGGNDEATPSNDYSHSCALLSDGSVDCWGYNGFGELGDGTTTQRRSPVVVTLQ